MKIIFRRLHRVRTAALTVLVIAAAACLGVIGASQAFASTTGMTPSFCLQSSSSYCLNDQDGADQTVDMAQNGGSDGDFIAQLTGRCGGYVTANCPFADTVLDTRYEGSPIVQLYDQTADLCAGTDVDGSALFAACNSVSTGTGGGDGTLFVNHNGSMMSVYWSDSGQYGHDGACMAPESADLVDGDGVSLDQDTSSGCPQWTFGHSAVADYATSIANGVPEYYAEMAGQGSGAFTGGILWYGWDGGHDQTPGPSAANCTGDPDCFTATTEHAAGNQSVHGYSGEITSDCSGFSRWVYSLAYGGDVLGGLDTVAQDNELKAVSDPTPGDLVFFDNEDATPTPNNSTHVGVYIGGNRMIDEPCTQIVGRTDCHVRVDNIDPATFGGIVGYYARQ